MASGLILSGVATLALLGCGRFGFSEVETANDAGADAAVEGVDAALAIDASLNAGVVGCTSSSLFCDGFEDGDLSLWTLATSGGSAELSTAQAYRGNSSVHVATLAAGGTARISRTHQNIASGTLYTRAYWYFPLAAMTTGTVELSNAGDDSGIHQHLAIDGDTPILIASNVSSGSTIPITPDTWTCIETEVEIAAAGRARLRVGNVLAASLDAVDTAVAGGYEAASLGAYYTADASGALEVFIDDVIISNAPIGCL